MEQGYEPTEYKTVPFVCLKVEEDQGVVEHLISVFGILDMGGDICHPGSFTKTITERKDQIRVLDAHRRSSILDAIGVPLKLREVGRAGLPRSIRDKHPEATGGLVARTQFLMDTPEGRGAFIRIKSKAVSEFSFAYDSLDEDFSEVEVEGKEVSVRNLRTIRLWEYGPVLFGMNPATSVLSAKGAAGVTGLSIADRKCVWDASAAIVRVRTWAGAKEKPNAKYRKAFFGYDKDNADTFGAYKLPFADVVRGALTAIPRGIFAVAAVLSGARGGAQISDADAVKSRVARYYARMRSKFDDDTIVVPWKKGGLLSLEEVDAVIPRAEKVIDVGPTTITVRVRDSGDFQEGSFRVINIGDEDDGIRARIGRLTGETTTTVQAYMFDKEKWTVERARAWVDEHKEVLVMVVPKEDDDIGGPEICICLECGYEADKERGVPCRSMTCPECGAKLVAKEEDGEGEETESAREQDSAALDLLVVEMGLIEIELAISEEAGPASTTHL